MPLWCGCAIRAPASGSCRTWRQPIGKSGFLDAGLSGILISGTLAPEIGQWRGRLLAEIAAAAGRPPEEMAMDLVLENGSDVFALYLDIDEASLRQLLKLPWVSICSDAESLAVDGPDAESGVHPRAYGAFARFLGRYVRDLGLITLPEAVRRMTSLPAHTLGLRGLAAGAAARARVSVVISTWTGKTVLMALVRTHRVPPLIDRGVWAVGHDC